MDCQYTPGTKKRATVRRLFPTVRRLALGTLFATNATVRQKNFNEINDLRAQVLRR